jgi:hypothetical protein
MNLTREILEPLLKKNFGNIVNKKVWGSKEPFKKNGFLDSHLGYSLPEYYVGSNLGLKDYKICFIHKNDENDLVVTITFFESPESSYIVKRDKILPISKYESYAE